MQTVGLVSTSLGVQPVRVKVDANPRNLCAEISAENRQLKETQRQLIAANGRLQTDLGRARRNARVYDSAATKALADLERYKQCAEEREEELQAMRMELESSKVSGVLEAGQFRV